MKSNTGASRYGTHRQQFESNRRKIYHTQKVCGICGQPVDFTLKYPHPLSATVDHIIPINKGGSKSALDNLQLAHFYCNRQKSDKILPTSVTEEKEVISNRELPQSINWKNYRSC